MLSLNTMFFYLKTNSVLVCSILVKVILLLGGTKRRKLEACSISGHAAIQGQGRR